MMKRFLSLVLCLCMMCTAAAALADSENQTPDAITGAFAGKSVDITAIATSTADEESAPVYSVEIVWGDMKFAWGHSKETTTATWNPESHTYTYTKNGTTEAATEGWYMLNEGTALTHSGAAELDLTTQNAVLVFNHSNRSVKAEITIEDVTVGDTDGLEAEFSKTSTSDKLSTTDNVHTLTRGTEGDIFADDGSSVMGTVWINEDKPISTGADYAAATPIAKLNVTISKAE